MVAMETNAGSEVAAAALAAIQQFLAHEQATREALAPPTLYYSHWHEGVRLAQTGLRPQRLPVPLSWATVERLRRL